MEQGTVFDEIQWQANEVAKEAERQVNSEARQADRTDLMDVEELEAELDTMMQEQEEDY